MYFQLTGLFLSVYFYTVDARIATSVSGLSYDALPPKAIFPGPWDDYIQAPLNKTHIKPKAIWRTQGNVTTADALVEGSNGKSTVMLGPGGFVTLDFTQNIAGR